MKTIRYEQRVYMETDGETDGQLIQFQSKRKLLWLFNVASKNEIYWDRHLKVPDNFCPIKNVEILDRFS